MMNCMERRDYGSAKAYADEVRQWVNLTQAWMLEQHRGFLQGFRPPSIQPIVSQNIDQNIQNDNGLPAQFARRIMFRIGINGNEPPELQTIITQEYNIPSFARRCAAELLDFLILFFWKMIFVYFLVDDLDQYVKILADDVDLTTLIDITQGLFHLELGAKIICGIIEAYCISFGFMGYPIGCTPGKYLMKIQVVSCLDITPIPGQRDRVTISRKPSVPFGQSLIRALIKNSVFNVLFPLNTLLYFFSYNRAVYDIAAKTIVVSF